VFCVFVSLGMLHPVLPASLNGEFFEESSSTALKFGVADAVVAFRKDVIVVSNNRPQFVADGCC